MEFYFEYFSFNLLPSPLLRLNIYVCRSREGPSRDTDEDMRSPSGLVNGLVLSKGIEKLKERHMGTYEHRYHLRLDEPTERALEQICRCTFSSKSTLMRRYVQQGVAKDIATIADQVERVERSCKLIETLKPEMTDASIFVRGWSTDEEE